MEERTIEVNVVSASDLKNVKTFGGQQTSYVEAYIFPQQRRKTNVDTKGGLNPSWNSKLTLTCDERFLERGGSYLTLEIYSHGALSDKLIGTVSIPLHLPVTSDGSEPKTDASIEEYEVRRPSGKAKGQLKVSVKLGEKRTIQNAGTQQGYAYSQDYKNQARPTYPPATFGTASAGSYYPGNSAYAPPAGGVYPPQNYGSLGPISPYASASPYGSAAAYPPPPPKKIDSETGITGYTTGGTTGVNASVPAYPPTSNPPSAAGASGSTSAPNSSSEPVTAYPAVGYPVPTGYPTPPQYGQQYAPPPYYAPQAPYYPPQPPQYYQKPPKRSNGGLGLGAGLLGGALGGLLIGDMLGDMGDFDC
ncbi:hypothetical protein MPTK1_6g00390 [Marchantia polymorpha subsp. ruderalis]|nr:hypothetical protein MARPO_0104s0027 [Marchantia polymorpha]BBN13047.1 hypothetical protein Mp_6g00390 [Marchantia polymorpha subsp. ruderalis]|eukprot:PTQ31998.1 hypothetical protein MARPO_0104s0027 [Marchantia polymorpha]